jgi:D-alanyl-D-alanine dipeptidase
MNLDLERTRGAVNFHAMHLAEITQNSHGVCIDLKYATADNIAGRPIYRNAQCYLRPEAERCLRKAVELAAAIGLQPLIFDAYRPPAAQHMLWQACPDPDYIVPPEIGSNHARGTAVDLTLIDANGTPLDMGTGFDEMTQQSHHGRTDISAKAQQNRLLLLGLMTAAGWQTLPTEWWHFQLPGDWPIVVPGEGQMPIM